MHLFIYLYMCMYLRLYHSISIFRLAAEWGYHQNTKNNHPTSNFHYCPMGWPPQFHRWKGHHSTLKRTSMGPRCLSESWPPTSNFGTGIAPHQPIQVSHPAAPPTRGKPCHLPPRRPPPARHRPGTNATRSSMGRFMAWFSKKWFCIVNYYRNYC